MIGTFISIAVSLIFGICFYTFRRIGARNHSAAHRFLDKKYNTIRRGMFSLRNDEYITRSTIFRWGLSGVLLLPLPAFNLSLDIEKWLSFGGISSVSLLLFAGMFFGDSAAAIYFLRKLGIDHYKPKAEQ